MRLIFLNIASGSKGNASFINFNNKNILIDVGVSLKRLEEELIKINKSIKDITDLIITHEHIDHVKGLNSFLKVSNCNIYLTEGTNKELKIKEANIIKGLESFILESLQIMPIPLSHDANEPIGLVFKNDKNSLCYITDTGFIHQSLLPLLKNHDLYYLEANHDPYTLTNCNRPFYLINRIRSEKGHLSNQDSAYQFSLMAGENTKHLIHAHISEDCNKPSLIEETFNNVLTAQNVDKSKIKFYYASQTKALPVIKL